MELRPASLTLRPIDTGNSPESIRSAARQLESQFAKMMIGMMRQSAMGDSLFPGAAAQYRDLYDAELANSLTREKGLGLQPMIRRSLGEPAAPPSAAPAAIQGGYGLEAYRGSQSSMGALRPPISQPIPISRIDVGDGHPKAHGPLDANQPSPLAERTPALDRSPATAYAASVPGDPDDFVREMWPHAQRAAAELGVSPQAILAQAALETGWGRRVIRNDDGTPAHNLFGIKAGSSWQGERVVRQTSEHVDGSFVRHQAAFRAYDGAAEGFADYVRLLRDSPRYQQALGAGDASSFGRALQRAGYATDPSYAEKIAAIANGPTMRRALDGLAAEPLRSLQA